MRKTFKIIVISFFVLLVAGAAALGFYCYSVLKSANVELDESKLTSPSLSVSIFDNEKRPVKDDNSFNSSYIKSSAIPQHTKDAFISIEDKNFYKHNGVNYKRMAKAMANNIKSGKLKEGASTISQQLIKNTHLTSEKTFDRKIKEIALAKKLEKKFSKDEILQAYLNCIYFGSNCYGIEDASQYYFSKNAHDLTIDESALLAGLIKSPNAYSPISHPDKCIARRNIVLNEMLKDGKITEKECFDAKNTKISLNLSKKTKNKLNSYSQACIDEACSILKMPTKKLALGGYKIYSNLDTQKQASLEKSLEKISDCDHAGLVLDNKKSAVVAYYGKSPFKILTAKRQPGSAIKPVLVYAPALNEDIIYPCTQLLDEKTTIAGYSPKNVSGKFQGYVSAREALSKSINIPAVKVLSYIGIDKAKSYASDMGIQFDEKDDSYALALGGMSYGTNLLDMCGAYSTFANGGIYSRPKFISYITDKNDKIVYIAKCENKRVLREDACFLLTDMLKTCAQTGTAKKLGALGKNIASKTGTVGKPNSNLNLDAWNITYTPNTTVGVWAGNLDNEPINIAGGGAPTQVVKDYLSLHPDEDEFFIPNEIVTKKIDSIVLNEEHRVCLANDFMPDRYTQEEIFTSFNLPRDISKKFVEIENFELSAKAIGNKAKFSFNAKDFYTYEIYNGEKLVDCIIGKNGLQEKEYQMTKEREKFTFKIYFTNMPNNYIQKDVQLLSQQSKSKWYV